MLYKVSELSIILGVTRTTVYNKVKALKHELKPYTRHKKGILMIDDEGLEIIKKSLEVSSTSHSSIQNTIQEDFTAQADNIDNTYVAEDIKSLNIQVDNELLNHLKDEVYYLRKENESKSNLVAMQQQSIQNMQILLKQEQEQKILLLNENTFTKDTRSEDHYKNLDDKISLIQERMNELALTKQENKKGFFKKFMK